LWLSVALACLKPRLGEATLNHDQLYISPDLTSPSYVYHSLPKAPSNAAHHQRRLGSIVQLLHVLCYYTLGSPGMTFHWQSSTSGQTAHYASTSTQSLLTTHKHLQYDDVPAGTVASRVQYLQNLANPRSARSPFIAIQRRENSRTDFGRRLTSRFAEPASQNHNPNEQTQVEASHSFLGLSTPRKNHEEEHAMANQSMKFDRTPGIHGQIKPRGVIQRVQYDAVSPWPALSNLGLLKANIEHLKGNLTYSRKPIVLEMIITTWHKLLIHQKRLLKAASIHTSTLNFARMGL
jgi:hypothetical protein